MEWRILCFCVNWTDEAGKRRNKTFQTGSICDMSLNYDEVRTLL